MHRLLVSAPLALALTACTQLPPANDREATRLDLSQRLHTNLPPSPSGLDTACTTEVMALLKAPLTEDKQPSDPMGEDQTLPKKACRWSAARAASVT